MKKNSRRTRTFCQEGGNPPPSEAQKNAQNVGDKEAGLTLKTNRHGKDVSLGDTRERKNVGPCCSNPGGLGLDGRVKQVEWPALRQGASATLTRPITRGGWVSPRQALQPRNKWAEVRSASATIPLAVGHCSAGVAKGLRGIHMGGE